MAKKILYTSCHEILEYDELKLFAELGYECYSLGAYTQPGGDENRKRPPLELPYNPHFIELALQYTKYNIHPEMLEGIDIVIVMHDTKVIRDNWPLFKEFIDKGGRVIWRSIGQSVPARERELAQARAEGMEVVRYSPAEMTIEDNIGEDAMIRFYKDPDEYKDWNGNDNRVINFTQSLQERGRFTGYMTWIEATMGLPRVVYGPGNEDLGKDWGGMLSSKDQIKALQDGRCYFYHGTYPASYTLTLIEAMMTGIPVVAVGPALGNGREMFPQQSTYEVDTIIRPSIDGLWSDEAGVIRNQLKQLLDDKKLAKTLGTFGRQRAIELFGKQKIKSEWREYLDNDSKPNQRN